MDERKAHALGIEVSTSARFAEYYVIGVSGLPVISGHGEGTDNTDSYDALKEATKLEAKGQEPAQPGIIQQESNDTSTILFGFFNRFVDLSKVKTATFITNTGPLNVKAKFDLARMTYKGKLAI